MERLTPRKLRRGDTVRVIAPACSLAMIDPATRAIADRRLQDLGLRVTFGRHVEESDAFTSSSVQARIEDLHEAFADPQVAAILTVIGGYNSNQLLRSIDWELIRAHPTILCGYSDITALQNAIWTRTGLMTYSGPHYSTFGQKLHAEYTVDYFVRCLMDDAPFAVQPSAQWSDDAWYRDQDERTLVPNDGYIVLHEGVAEGPILGGNLCTLNLLQGTEYMPDLAGAILFLEDDEESQPHTFDRDLQSLIHQPGFEGVGGLAIGRFQRASQMTPDLLRTIISTKRELRTLPIIAGIDFGHTDPKVTFPIGGVARLTAAEDRATLEISVH
jgi:muramoyltetrapeptide carboxypeptidase LdcA involved in peptidoglycan recycling